MNAINAKLNAGETVASVDYMMNAILDNEWDTPHDLIGTSFENE